MYLSKLILNRKRRTFHWASDAYHIHQRLMMGAGHDPRLLFRLELPSRAGQGDAYILAQTIEAPNWAAAFDQFPVLVGEPLCKAVAYDLHPGQLLTFRLRANPTARKRLPDGSKKRVGILTEEEQRGWLRRKSQIGGFDVVHAWIREDPPLMTRVERDGKIHRLRLVSAQFEGVLRVKDPHLLTQTIAQGIGSGKGLGFGLLSIGPVRG